MIKRPLVSILTPSYNQGRFIGDCIASVANQTYRPIEHIVCDGGSTDETLEILRNASAHVRWVSEPDRGQSHALNKALAMSQGEIIGWLNSDDGYFNGQAVAAAIRVFQEHPEVDVVYGHAALVNGDGLILQMIWVPGFNYWTLRRHNFIIQPAAFIRRTALTDFVADEKYDYAMDRELWLRLGANRRFKRVNRVLAIDRHHSARKSSTRPDLARADAANLATTYGVPKGALNRVRLKVLKIAFRLAGTSLLRAANGPLAFSGSTDGYWRLVRRQVAVKRAAMPAEGSR